MISVVELTEMLPGILNQLVSVFITGFIQPVMFLKNSTFLQSEEYCYSQAYSDSSRTSRIGLFAKIVNGFKPLIIFANSSNLRCSTGFCICLWQWRQHLFKYNSKREQNVLAIHVQSHSDIGKIKCVSSTLEWSYFLTIVTGHHMAVVAIFKWELFHRYM